MLLTLRYRFYRAQPLSPEPRRHRVEVESIAVRVTRNRELSSCPVVFALYLCHDDIAYIDHK
jgi:hypothetical protein